MTNAKSKVLKTLGGAAALIIILSMSVYTVDEGERGIQLTMGKVSDVVEPGMHLQIPFFQDVVFMSTRTQTARLNKIGMYSFDQQTAELGMSVTWRYEPSRLKEAYARFGASGLFQQGVVPRVLEISKAVFGRYTAERSIQERSRLNEDMNTSIKESLAGLPFILENVQIENIDFTDSYEKAVEQAARAKADVERSKSELLRVEQEAQQKVKQAQAEAEAIKLKADADAYAVMKAGEAEAAAIAAKGRALKENPELVRLIQAETWDGKLPTTMIPGGTLPFIDLKH